MFRSNPLKLALSVSALIVCQFSLASMTAAQSSTLTGVVIKGRKYTGKVMFRDASTLALLRRDGGLSTYPASDVNSTVNLHKKFGPYPQGELEDRLRGEFPNGYAVAFTDNFAVVYPANSTFAWGTAFERLHRQFVHYFEARGMTLERSEFPLIAIVLRTRADFDRYLDRVDLKNTKNVVGFYSLKSNRIITYDQAMSPSSEHANENTATVIHEAAHQSAFNTGVHERFRPVPRWVTEGLATMFEAKGIHNNVEFPSQRDRIDTAYWPDFQKLMKTDAFRGKIKTLVSSDELFDSDPKTAYALAWGLTLYLAENRSESYQQYLHATKNRLNFSHDNAEQRLQDFCGIFGDDLRDLEIRVMKFYQDLDIKPEVTKPKLDPISEVKQYWKK